MWCINTFTDLNKIRIQSPPKIWRSKTSTWWTHRKEDVKEATEYWRSTAEEFVGDGMFDPCGGELEYVTVDEFFDSIQELMDEDIASELTILAAHGANMRRDYQTFPPYAATDWTEIAVHMREKQKDQLWPRHSLNEDAN